MKQPRMLEHYPAVRTSDSETARQQLIEIYGAERADIKSPRTDGLLHANHVQMKDVALSYCEYGVDARVEFPESSYVRQLFKIRGLAQASADNKLFSLTRQNWAALIPDNTRFGLVATPNYQQLVLRVERHAVQRVLSALIGEVSSSELVFNDTVDFESYAARSFRRRVLFFASELDVVGSNFSALAAAELERSLIVYFLLCNQHSHSKFFLNEPAESAPITVRRVEEYIEAYWDSPLDLETLVSVAKVSARSILRQFKKTRGYSPLTFIKQTRLKKARALLLNPTEEATVTSIALRCGFQNIGHFAADYRQEFRELPSETLAKSRH